MATYIWKNAVNGSWNSAASWQGNKAPPVYHGHGPEPHNTAIFDTGSNQYYTVTGKAEASVLAVSHDKVTFSDFDFTSALPGRGDSSFDITVSNGAAVDFTQTATFTGSGTDTLKVNDASVLLLGNLSVVLDIFHKATVKVSGTAARLTAVAGRDSDLGSIDSGSRLLITHGAIVRDQAIVSRGHIDIQDKGSTLDGIGNSNDNAAGASIVGSDGAILSGTIHNAGTIEARSGVFHVSATVASDFAGGGSFKIDRGATLDLGTSQTQDVAFLNGATLQLEKGVSEAGFLKGFGKGDSIHLEGVHVTGLATLLVDGHTTLTAYDGTSVVETFRLTGYYTPSELHVHAANGGTFIDYVAKMAHPLDAIRIA